MKHLSCVITIATIMTVTACGQRADYRDADQARAVGASTSVLEEIKAEAEYRTIPTGADVKDKVRPMSQIKSIKKQSGELQRPTAKIEKIAVTPTRSKALQANTAAVASPVIALYPAPQPADRENYLEFESNEIKRVADTPISTFSIDVDTAAYSNIRRMLDKEGRIPPRDAIKIEEMINYFNYDYANADSAGQPFSVSTEVAPAPWNPDRYLLQIGLKGYQPALTAANRSNLVFLIDVSGSMQSADKLGLVKKSLRMLVNQMHPEDRIAIAVYAGSAGLVLDSTPVRERRTIHRAIDQLRAGGSTNGSAGIHLAYDVATENFVKNGINRVIIASDGDLNVGITDLGKLKQLIAKKRDSGVALTTLGFGTGNYNYALMEQLADVGDGNAAYIDSMREAQKVLVNEMQSTLMTIARDVKIQIEFNPALVSEYRLIGYENRRLKQQDFSNDKVDAGDIGAGHSVTALYEISLANGQDKSLIPTRYAANKQTQQPENNGVVEQAQPELAYVRLRYKQPGEQKSIETATPIMASAMLSQIAQASENLRFAAAVAGFGQLLRGSEHTGNWNYQDALAIANNARGADRNGYRGEFIGLIQLAASFTNDS